MYILGARFDVFGLVTTRTTLSVLAAAALACGGGATIGEPCDDGGDCAEGLQCLRSVCTPLCANHTDCGDGFLCELSGTCSEVQSEIGDACGRELDCGPGQACSLDDSDQDADGFLAASCQSNQPGAVTGATCTDDGDCRNGLCALGRCSELCVIDTDCPLELSCEVIPKLIAGEATPVFAGCLQGEGVLEMEVPQSAPSEQLFIPVPSHARSFALVASVEDEGQLVGADSLRSPDDQQLYRFPLDNPQTFFENPIRHAPAPGVSTMLVPNTPNVELMVGFYDVVVSSFFAQGFQTGTEIPTVKVFYKLDDDNRLDLNFYFLNLEDHPCADAFDVPTLNASTAQISSDFQETYLVALRGIIENAGLEVGDVTYTDKDNRPEHDGLLRDELGELLKLSQMPAGLTVFFVRSIAPEGIQALSGGSPGPPQTAQTRASGVAVSLDTLCYRSWDTLARVTGHAAARQMGLFRNVEPGNAQFQDTIPDTDGSSDNLLYFGEFGGTQLTDGQRSVLSVYPGLR